MKILLFKCDYEHYFRNVSCPYDGWTCPDIRRVEQLFNQGIIKETNDLYECGIDKSLIQRIIIIDIAKEGCPLEGVAIQSLVIDGTLVKKFPNGTSL